MKVIAIEMPRIRRCEAGHCAYNNAGACLAKAITVGDQVTPHCDTFFSSETHAHVMRANAGVGACKVSTCKFNQDFECTADEIKIGMRGEDVLCLTFKSKQGA